MSSDIEVPEGKVYRWEKLQTTSDETYEITERMKIEQGWLYRTQVWNSMEEGGVPVSMVFVAQEHDGAKYTASTFFEELLIHVERLVTIANHY